MKTAIFVLLLTTITLTASFPAKSQTNPKLKPPSWVGIPIGSTKEGVSQDVINEYSNIVLKYGDTGEQWWTKFEENISATDRGRLEQIFKQMSAEQQAKQKVAFVKAPSPLKKIVPSDKELNAWKNANVYGVWINGKKVDNAILNKYKNTDFNQATVSKLYGTANQNKKYSYQVNLMTKDYYQKYHEQTIAKGGNRMVFRA